MRQTTPSGSFTLRGMETINGCTVIRTSEATELVRFGPAETAGSYVVEVGSFPPGEPGPPFHLHPNTDETFYVADGQATFRLGDRELQLGAGGLVFVPRGTAIRLELRRRRRARLIASRRATPSAGSCR